jgi:hypothetical protein
VPDKNIQFYCIIADRMSVLVGGGCFFLEHAEELVRDHTVSGASPPSWSRTASSRSSS